MQEERKILFVVLRRSKFERDDRIAREELRKHRDKKQSLKR